MAPSEKLVLASASPRRSEILRGLGLGFEIDPAHIDESALPDEAPDAHVLRLATSKAGAKARPEILTLGADTIVVIDARIVTKPDDPGHAREILADLAGREHEVLTGVALVRGSDGRTASALERTRVRLVPMSSEEIAWYVASGEPLDKAGAYAIQGLGSLFVESIDGNYTNVVGLPVPALYRLFEELDASLLDFRKP